ncbi:hypothetical protein S40288_05852 [Stachybotrys chartarum IBT 40288]|nr:hypothetical protein S40288_05852 [Stachybotrys chartarum IBT 40288]
MVGVPGRSKACSTCRRRRKGCDQQRPACGQCIRAALPCGGYERQRIFVQMTPDDAAGGPLYRSDAPKVLPDALALSAFEESHLAEFWQAYLPGADGDEVLAATGTQLLGVRHWIKAVQQLYVSDVSLKKALLAMSLSTLGKATRQNWMIEEGLRQQIGAVSLMKKALKASSLTQKESIMGTARLISLFVILHGANKKDTLSHTRSWQGLSMGELAIITSRSPEAYTSGHAHHLFVEGRQQLAFGAISLRRRTNLTSPEWMNIPWSLQPKTPRDYMTDIMLHLPEILEYTTLYMACDDAVEKERLRLKNIELSWKCDRFLQDWARKHCPIKIDTDRAVEEAMPELRENLALAYMMTHYWGACLLIYGTLRTMLDPREPLPDRTELRQYCRYQTALIPAFYSPKAGVAGRHMVSFTVVSTIGILRAIDVGVPSPEIEFIMGYIEKFGFVKAISERTFPDPLLRKSFRELAKMEGLRQAYRGLSLPSEATSSVPYPMVAEATPGVLFASA